MRGYFHVHHGGASPQEIQDVCSILGHGLPHAYIALLRETNGAEGGIHDTGGDCLTLWSTHELIQLNRDYQIIHWLPQCIAIGGTGGDDAIILDMCVSFEPNYWPVARVPFGDLDRAAFQPLASSFAQWVQEQFRLVPRPSTATSP